MAQRSSEAVQAIVAAWSGSVEPLVGLLADHVEWWDIGLAEPHGGPAAADHLRRRVGDGVVADVHDVLANDEHIVALIHATATKGTHTFSYSIAEVYHVDAEGHVTKRQAFAPDTAVIAEFFGPG